MGTGIMLDSRRKIGPKGKFRPFVLYAAFPVTLLAIANFVGTPFEVTGKTVVATMLFMLYGLVFSMMNCSYGAMVPAITKNPDERASLAARRQGGATLGLLLCTVGFVPVMNLIEGNAQLSYIFAATLFSLFGLLFMWLCYAGVKERYVEVKPVDSAQKLDYCSRSAPSPVTVRCLFCVSPTFVLLAPSTSNWRFRFITPSTFLTTRSSSHGWASLAWAVFLSAFLMPGAVRRFGKKKVYIGGLLIWVAGDLLNYFFGGGSVSFVAFSCPAFFGSAFVNSLNWALVSDTVEYGEWRTGVRSEGTVYTGFTFFRKVSQALAGFFPGWMLTQIGYIPNVVQSAGTVEGLRQLIFIYPCVLAVITIIAMGCFYNLNEKMYVRIVEEIEARKHTV